MASGRDGFSLPDSDQEQLDSACAPYFDADLDAWVFSAHADLVAAFNDARLVPVGGEPAEGEKGQPSEQTDENEHLKMRASTREALSPERLRAWREQLNSEAGSLTERLPAAEPIEMMSVYARPLSLAFAAIVTGISLEDAEQLNHSARIVSIATAAPEHEFSRERAAEANARLRDFFSSGPESLRDSGFVGLSQTLPCLLGNAWCALAAHPAQWRHLHLHPELMDQAIEELLRYAGTVRTIKRTAATDLEINGCQIRKGERVVLRIEAANRDPERFSRPGRVDCTRRDAGHFTFGAGNHSCVAANLIRMAMKTMTAPLAQRFAAARLVRPVDWKGGSVFRFPGSLWVSFERG
jgi:cytochrome P450